MQCNATGNGKRSGCMHAQQSRPSGSICQRPANCLPGETNATWQWHNDKKSPACLAGYSLVVPAELNGPSPIVGLARHTGPLNASGVAVVEAGGRSPILPFILPALQYSGSRNKTNWLWASVRIWGIIFCRFLFFPLTLLDSSMPVFS